MRALSRTFPVLLVALAAACGDNPDEKDKPSAAGGPTVAPPAIHPAPAPAGTKPTTPVKRGLPKFPPLTEEIARRVLRGQLDRLGGDDVSRQALLYMADLGDRSAVNVLHEKLLAVANGKFEDLSAAAIGAEASLAYGEPGAAATVLKVSKQYTEDEEDADEYLVRALARIDGPERAEATAALVKIADAGDDQIAPLAVEMLARNAAQEARATFFRIASDETAEGRIRGSAVAGLLRINDPAGKDLAEKLVAEAVKPDNTVGAQPEDVAAGFGVEGAVETVPYIQKLVDASLAEEAAAGTVWVAEEAAAALVHIHAKGGGSALVPWLQALAKKSDSEYEDSAALALWAFGDEPSATLVAASLEGSVAAWSTPSNMDPAVEILDIAARRGVAAKAPLRTLVDSAAQVDPAAGDKAVNQSVISLNLAAAHAFLKSGAK